MNDKWHAFLGEEGLALLTWVETGEASDNEICKLSVSSSLHKTLKGDEFRTFFGQLYEEVEEIRNPKALIAETVGEDAERRGRNSHEETIYARFFAASLTEQADRVSSAGSAI